MLRPISKNSMFFSAAGIFSVVAGATVGMALFLSSVAWGRSLECNRDQTRCVTESTQLTIGDKVGIFNSEGELVASGEISSMRGDRRAVLIDKRHGAIRRGYSLALLESSAPADDRATMYKVYREPSKMSVGGSLGYSSVSIGEGSPATEFSAFGQMRKWNGLQLVGRGLYSAMEGEVTRTTDFGYERMPISVSTVGLLGGVGYVLRENKPISFRGELAVGAMYVSGTANGSASLMDDEDTNSNVKNGIAPGARWTLGVVWNLSAWHIHGDVAQSLVHEAFANTLALGLSRDLK